MPLSERIVMDPEVPAGEPVIRGTVRVTGTTMVSFRRSITSSRVSTQEPDAVYRVDEMYTNGSRPESLEFSVSGG